ncbi:MAG: ribosome biogenesis GTPase Der [Deltaproteobacteria bacterium]|nr:ribosome biogenesis GTPase Der [Deltaproteobacteria bacterium]
MSRLPLIAIVGRPNVGKSTLYNRLVGGRPALVHDTPGLTRDRRYGECDYFGTMLRLIDTGGLDPEAEAEVIGAGIHRQAWRGIDEADAIVLVVDAMAGVTPLDSELAAKLRTTGKPIMLVANKVDSPKRDAYVAELYAMGLGEPYPVSAAHGRGVDAMLEALIAKLPKAAKAAPAVADDPFDAAFGGDADEDADDGDDDADDDDGDDAVDAGPVDEGDVVIGDPDDDDDEYAPDPEDEHAPEDDGVLADDEPRDRTAPLEDAGPRSAHAARRADKGRGDERKVGPLRVAFIGKPNAGKSSLTNRLIGEERSLVHHVPGTTTDPVDTPFEMGGKKYVLVDTAGIRRRARIDEEIEKIAVSMALGQIQRADVCVLVIDASLGPGEQDARLAGAVEESGRALVIALNKSDLIRGKDAEAELKQKVKDTFHFMPWAPVVMLSAARGDGTHRLMDLASRVAAEHRHRVATSELNRFFAEVVEVTPPGIYRGRAIRIHYITQARVAPPTFLLWANQPTGVAPSYRRYLSNQLRKRYGFRGSPIRIFVKDKGGDRREDDAPVRPKIPARPRRR